MRECFVAMIAACCLVGCGGGLEEFTTAPVTGKVMCKGEPLARAYVAFNPLRKGESAVVGKQGFAITNENGEFVLGTYDQTDGGVIGEHSVRVWLMGESCDCVVGDSVEVRKVEVKGGEDNEFTFELPEANRRQKMMQDEQAAEERDDEEDE
ncbi:hypothetical protein AB1L42_05565 [Thalassoglobus sp. JC818]|uniref:hypothetical protein n=1 Tax=Thalassoglobus sp. JC818 TaxID=3232136 RepID=UPI0034594921